MLGIIAGIVGLLCFSVVLALQSAYVECPRCGRLNKPLTRNAALCKHCGCGWHS